MAEIDRIDREVQAIEHVAPGEVGTYYLDFALDEDEGAVVETHLDSQLGDLELLFQEQLIILAEEAAEQHALKKGKAVLIECELDCSARQQDHQAIMVLEESEVASTRPDELITPQSGGGSRWYVQPKPHLRRGGDEKKTPI